MPDLNNEAFVTAHPISKKISPFIAYYYFHSSADKDFERNFSYYPNYKHALTAYLNSEVSLKNNISEVRPSEEKQIRVLYSINKKDSIKVNIRGAFSKIGIVFNPLGINHFIKEDLQEIFSGTTGNFDYFGKALHYSLTSVFEASDLTRKTLLLDEFFERHYVGFPQPKLKQAIHEFLLSNGAIKVNELSEKLNLNRRSLLRLFKIHTKMNVEDYRKMIRFRKAFNYYQQNKEKTTLTEVALYSMYYDQAHFIKHFKSITKENPTSLLAKIAQIGEEETYWYFF